MVKRQIREIKRSRNLRPIKQNIYISCEGDAEEAYLNGLKRRYSRVATIKISNSSPDTSAPDVVKNLKKKYKNEYSREDLRYCIFDCDDNTPEQLQVAQRLANLEHAQIIFSNPCFEIWLLWHYENSLAFQSSRNALKRQIETYIRPEYWSCKETPNLYDLIRDNTTQAILNYEHRKLELEQDNVIAYSRESNPYSNFYDLINKLISLEATNPIIS